MPDQAYNTHFGKAEDMAEREVKKHRLLIVEDDRVQRMMLRKVLENAGYDVMEAEDGEIGLARYLDTEPDMVLLDVIMPRMDGFEACKRMRNIPKAEPIPILMLTGLEDTLAVDLAFEAGATDFITKPINWTMLSQRVRYALRAHDNAHALRLSQQRLVHAQQLARLGYWEWNTRNDHLTWSHNAADLLGVLPPALAPTMADFAQQVHPDDWARLHAGLTRLSGGDGLYEAGFRVCNERNELRFINCVAEATKDSVGAVVRIVGSIQDITALKQAEALIEYQRYHDALTRLPNRRFFMERLQTLLGGDDPDCQVGVIVLGLDRFKIVNESLGAAIGDRVLQEIGQRLLGFQAEGGGVARIGGDEFGIVVESQARVARIEQLAERIRALVSQPCECDSEVIYLTASLGIALYPVDSLDANGLLGCANAARSRARLAGGDQFQFFIAELTERAARRLRLENELRHALAHAQLTVYYQPLVACHELRIVGAEALLRWTHPELGAISPAEFIPIAEESGQIVPIGEWVLATACHQAKDWTDRGFGEVYIGVNLSIRQLAQKDLVHRVQTILAKTGLAPGQLGLEITESMAMQNPEANIALLRQLAELGIKLSIDDFGTGHSSLNYLHKLPVATIKIDRSFIVQLAAERFGKGIVTTILALARVLGMSVVAEGVEDEQQVDFLRQHGCDYLQGYRFGRPMPAQEFAARLAATAPCPPPLQVDGSGG